MGIKRWCNLRMVMDYVFYRSYLVIKEGNSRMYGASIVTAPTLIPLSFVIFLINDLTVKNEQEIIFHSTLYFESIYYIYMMIIFYIHYTPKKIEDLKRRFRNNTLNRIPALLIIILSVLSQGIVGILYVIIIHKGILERYGLAESINEQDLFRYLNLIK